jgi:class 3 adenylate cyclase
VGIESFEFERSRGIVWVCDLSKSSTFLNDNDTASALESFLPRLYWASAMTVEAAGGRFIKWTGDGFLAWFETPHPSAHVEHD